MSEQEEMHDSVRIVILVPPCLKAELRRYAKQYERSLSGQCAWIVKEWLNSKHAADILAAEQESAPA